MNERKAREQRTRLANALDTWHSWSAELATQPRVLRELNTGSTNSSYKVGCDNRNDSVSWPASSQKYYCLRLNANNSARLGINRTHEVAVLRQLKGHALSPTLRYYDSNNNFCVFDYIEGRCWSRSDFTRLTQRQRLHDFIKNIQNFSVDIPRFNYLSHLSNYRRQVEQLAPEALAPFATAINAFFVELEGFMAADWRPVLCHHDLIPENILETDEGLILLDWEYAGLGHPEFDQRYVQHCLDNRFERDAEALLSGDTLDRLIYWLVFLWNELSKVND